ncbi:MAG: endonuclease MutS2 [Christensenellaceae bacterium]|nr:endonuclease MutS2 [Christensenellaceae bacterium]
MISKKTAAMLEFDRILEMASEKTVSEKGREAMLSLQPVFTSAEASLLMEQTKEAESIIVGRPSYPMVSFSSISSELARLNTGATMSMGELLRLNSVYKASKHAKVSIMNASGAENLKTLAWGLEYDERTIRMVTDSILSDEEMADRASDTLYKIRRSIVKENEFIREKLRNIIRKSEYSSALQDSIITQRNGRYVVPVKQENKSKVPGIVHAQSGTGATLFIEPASVVEANNRISELIAEEQAEIERILTALTALFRSRIDDIRRSAGILSELDVLFAKASVGISMNAVPVEFSDGIFHVINGRHPLIPSAEVVPVDVDLKEGTKALIITGPNTGGKTVTLKLCGLFALMAQCGMFVPADQGVKLPVFDGVFADIGDEQSISQSLSTFSAHIKNVIYILRKSTERSLVLLDELGAGTEPQEGSALAMAVLDTLSEKGCRVFASTHYSELKNYASGKEGFENASMEFDAVNLKPTFRLIVGIPGMSNALLIAKRLGLKAGVLDRAYGYLSAEQTAYTDLMSYAQKASQQAEKDREEAEAALKRAKEAEEKAQEKLRKAGEKAKAKLKKADEKALEILSDASDESESLIKEARRTKGSGEAEITKTAKTVRDGFSRKKEEVSRHLKKERRIGRKPEIGEIKEGIDVRIISMDIEAKVLNEPDSRGMLTVAAGMMKAEVSIDDIEIIEGGTASEPKRTSRIDLDRRKTVSMSIDLHGMAVDEACFALDKYLDDAFLSGLATVTVVHGRGTGVLKKGVREFLRTHSHVKSMRPGKYDEGGDGATVVELK